MLTFDINDKKFCKNMSLRYGRMHYNGIPFNGKLISKDADGNSAEIIYKDGYIHCATEEAAKFKNTIVSEEKFWYKEGSSVIHLRIRDWCGENGIDMLNMDETDRMFLQMRWY